MPGQDMVKFDMPVRGHGTALSDGVWPSVGVRPQKKARVRR